MIATTHPTHLDDLQNTPLVGGAAGSCRTTAKATYSNRINSMSSKAPRLQALVAITKSSRGGLSTEFPREGGPDCRSLEVTTSLNLLKPGKFWRLSDLTSYFYKFDLQFKA